MDEENEDHEVTAASDMKFRTKSDSDTIIEKDKAKSRKRTAEMFKHFVGCGDVSDDSAWGTGVHAAGKGGHRVCCGAC
mgnify:CR=1 FL=1